MTGAVVDVPLSIIRQPGYRAYVGSRFTATFAIHIVSVAVAWQIYDLTRDPFLLGLVGLAQFLPSLALLLVTGLVADRFSRRMVMGVCLTTIGLAAVALLALSRRPDPPVAVIFALVTVVGVARAFHQPAMRSLLANIVPRSLLPRAVAFNTSIGQAAVISGPLTGGLLYGLGPGVAYGVAAAVLGVGALLAVLIPRPPERTHGGQIGWETLVAGFGYVRSNPVLLGAISLDLFAVLLGGATALLPVYARDILDVGPVGLGMLRSATAAGAISVALTLAMWPIRERAGLVMFWCVAGFGLATLVFGLSRSIWLSIAALVVAGGCDMISVFVRESLVQLATPDAMRGRVNAINAVFIGASNEVGEFRAGSMAALFGAVPAVVVGGIGTIAVAALWARLFPALRRVRHLDEPPPEPQRL